MGDSNVEKRRKRVPQCKWGEKSKLERNLIISLIIIIALFAALLLFVIIKPAVMSRKCITKSCLIAASEIIKQINPEIDPCTDFRLFACKDKRSNSIITDSKNFDEDVMQILKEPVQEDDHVVLKHDKMLYQTCLEDNDDNTDVINNTIAELGWPVVIGYQWREETFDWQQLIFKLRKIGYPFEMMLQVNVVKEGPAYTIKVSPPQIQNITKSVNLYKEYMTDVAVFFGADRKRAENEMEKVFYFAQFLKKISDWHSGSISTTVRNYLEENADIDWLNYINNVLYPVNQLSLDDYAQFPKREFTNEFHNLIYRTPKRVISNYIIWNALESSMEFMPRRLREIKNNYKCQTNTNEKVTRETFCKSTLKSFLPISMYILYARKHVPKDKRFKIKTLLDSVNVDFINTLKEEPWIDELSLNQSLNVLKNSVKVIGVPGDYFNDTIFQENSWPGVSSTNIDNSSFFQIILYHNCRHQNNRFYKLRYKSIQNNIYALITSFSASYDLESNAIILPVAVLQENFFSENRPMYLNYGMLGTMIGSELVRAIIQSSSEYDKNGDESHAWTELTRMNYDEKIKCFIENNTGGQETELNTKIEGIIADYSGIVLAYSSYRNWAKSNKREPYLNGINYDSNQLFWISSIARHCASLNSITNHVFTLVQNNDNFVTDFHCLAESTVTPSKECELF